ncbi:MAG: cyclic-di-AMP receptor [Oscillospiraceae bacterium]|nr:cyclic-di-AMP receptor [Oscillospiraceae bacterium]
MKLIMAIINHDDANNVIRSLTHAGYPVTKLATTGGFLMAGNVTIIIGVEDEKVNGALEIIGNHSHSRGQIVPAAPEMGMGLYAAMPIEITVGGATVFVLPVDKFVKY